MYVSLRLCSQDLPMLIMSFLFHTVLVVISSWLQTLTILCQSVASGYKLYSWVVGETQGRFRLDFGACRGFASPSSSNSAYVDFEQTDDEETFEPIFKTGYR
ncbi:hypothetical protein MAR_017600 [Mya arenaria]|uniref:Uncharacterized protein n=1 Tax=Mya arenaria TaxID=6604 RepID=A0ABY7ECA3_MYAAR|nr:hypothetical protein MAR_017600 [Mya arenaria]